MRNRELAITSKTRGLIQKTKGRLEKIGQAENLQEEKEQHLK